MCPGKLDQYTKSFFVLINDFFLFFSGCLRVMLGFHEVEYSFDHLILQMRQQHFSKIITLLILSVVGLFALMFYHSNQTQKAEVDEEIQSLKDQIKQQQSELNKTRKDLSEQVLAEQQGRIKQEAELQQKLLQKQNEINQIKEQKFNEQLDQVQELVSDLETQRQKQKELEERHMEISDKAMKASYLASGLQLATGLKSYVAEYYLANNRFPSKNKDLGLPRPAQYETDAVHAVWVSRGGKITVVFKANSGQDKGALNLIPDFKKESLSWKCETQDFKFIHEVMPTCRYIGKE